MALQTDQFTVDVLDMTGRLITLRYPATCSWCAGERKLGAALDALAGSGVVAIHDRLLPGTAANIDHVVVAPAGVWVIDAKNHEGRVARKDVGGLLGTDVRLYVGQRDRTMLVPAIWKQVAVVRAALGAEWSDVPVRPMLCFVGSDWGRFAKPFEVHGVVVTSPSAATELVARPGSYAARSVEQMAARLERSLRPAS